MYVCMYVSIYKYTYIIYIHTKKESNNGNARVPLSYSNVLPGEILGVRPRAPGPFTSTVLPVRVCVCVCVCVSEGPFTSTVLPVCVFMYVYVHICMCA
jgi:hypothetical protein